MCTKWQKLVRMLCAKPPICCKPTAITIQYGGVGAGEVSPDGAAGAAPLRQFTPKLLSTAERGERGGAAAAPVGARASAGSASRAELGEGEI